MNFLLRAILGGQVSLAIRLLIWELGLSSPPFQRLMDEAGYEDKHLLHDISSLLLIGLAPVSGVLSPKSVHATVSQSEFWSKVPQRNVEVFNRGGPTGDTELDRRASDKTHVEFALGLMDGPYNSLEECPGQHKVLVRRHLAGKVEMFAIFTIAPKTGPTKYLSPKRHTNLPVSTTTFLLSSNGKPPSLVSNYTGLLLICGNISGKLALV